jgi:hypothetical protein
MSTLLNFAETGARNWNFGGHVVTSAFTEAQGKWEYNDTTFEPWLFDRPDAWRMLAEMTGNTRWQTQAQSDLTYYESRLSSAGFFLNKTGEQDTKYSYVHPWSTNRAKNAAAYAATVQGFPNTANLSQGSLWTERELWVALNAAVKYYAVSNEPAVLARAKAMVDQWDAVCAGRKAPLVSYTLHEGGGPGGTTPTDLISSPWMSALYFQAARLYAIQVPAAAAQVNKQASDYFDWMNTPANHGFYDASVLGSEFSGMVFPAYLAGTTQIGDASPDEGNMDHALDVAGFVAFAIKAKQALGLPTAAAQTRLAQMKVTAELAFAGATRATLSLPLYRINPARKINWWIRGMYELKANGG